MKASRVAQLHHRYLKDPVSVRLANLASSLNRIAGGGESEVQWMIARKTATEAKYFIEWTMLECPERLWDELHETQVILSVLERIGVEEWRSERGDVFRQRLRAEVATLSEYYLSLSEGP